MSPRIDISTATPEAAKRDREAYFKAKQDQIDAALAEREKDSKALAPVKYTAYAPISPAEREYLLNVATHKNDDGTEEPCTPENEPEEFEPRRVRISDEGRAEFNAIVDEFWVKHGKFPRVIVNGVLCAVTAIDAPVPTDKELQSVMPSESDPLVAQLIKILETAKSSARLSDPKIVIHNALLGIRALERLDASYPSPLTSKSLHGILGDFVNIAHPTTVASKELLLMEMLPLVGAMLGDAFYSPFGSDRHYAALFSLIVARTSDGKGQAQRHCEEALKLVDPAWVKNNLRSNPASGEALVRMVAGPSLKLNSRKHRVAIFNSEMSTYFAASGRESSTLGGKMRQAYDMERLENFRSDSKKSVHAEDYILGFVGSITPRELKKVMPQMDWSNGAQNRFLWSVAEKDKSLDSSTPPNFAQWAERLMNIVRLNQSVEQPIAVLRSREAERIWRDFIQSLPEHDDTVLADSQARIKANAARVSVLYAQLDERRLGSGWQVIIEPKHVEAAIEIVMRSRQSVEWYLNQQNNTATKISPSDIQKIKLAQLEIIREGGELDSTEVAKIFSHKTSAERDEICLAAGLKPVSRKTRGRKVIVWT